MTTQNGADMADPIPPRSTEIAGTREYGIPNYLGTNPADYCGDHAAHDGPHDWRDELSDRDRTCGGIKHQENGFLGLIAREAQAVEAGYTEGDVNHVLQPIIGFLRLHQHDPDRWVISADEIERAVTAMRKACRSELAWIAAEPRLRPGYPNADT